MSARVSASLRRLVIERAAGLCEYCLIHSSDTFLGLEVEHVVPRKHGGESVESNLALACFYCNRHKGTDLYSVLPPSNRAVRIFNPRSDRWSDVFGIASDHATLTAGSDVGEVTLRLLKMNHPDRILERSTLHSLGRFPSPEALRRIMGSSGVRATSEGMG